MKRVLIISQYFNPESFKGNDIAIQLKKRGWTVDVLTGIPNYPSGKYYNGYGIFKKRIETWEGVNIYRAFQFPRGKSSKLMMILNYLSFPICSCFDVLIFFAWRKYDAIFVQQLSPIFCALPAILLKKLKKTPMFMWVLDIWPDALRSAANINNTTIISFIDSIVKFVYNNCDKILVSSKQFCPLICQKGNYYEKIIYFPNWSDDILEMSQEWPIPNMPDGFKIMIAGNLGISQNLDAVSDLMLGLKDIQEVSWMFLGDGSKKEWLNNFIKNNGLDDRAVCLGHYPIQAMPAFFNVADAMLVTLRAGFPHLEAVVPARLQTYMSAGKPVLAMIGSGGAEIIEEANCGYAVPAGDAASLIKIIKEKVLPDKNKFAEMGKNGRKYFETYYRKEMCIDNLEKIINKQ